MSGVMFLVQPSQPQCKAMIKCRRTFWKSVKQRLPDLWYFHACTKYCRVICFVAHHAESPYVDDASGLPHAHCSEAGQYFSHGTGNGNMFRASYSGRHCSLIFDILFFFGSWKTRVPARKLIGMMNLSPEGASYKGNSASAKSAKISSFLMNSFQKP